jgi:hypothetical protein
MGCAPVVANRQESRISLCVSRAGMGKLDIIMFHLPSGTFLLYMVRSHITRQQRCAFEQFTVVKKYDAVRAVYQKRGSEPNRAVAIMFLFLVSSWSLKLEAWRFILRIVTLVGAWTIGFVEDVDRCST